MIVVDYLVEKSVAIWMSKFACEVSSGRLNKNVDGSTGGNVRGSEDSLRKRHHLDRSENLFS